MNSETWWNTANFALILAQFKSFSDQLDLWYLLFSSFTSLPLLLFLYFYSFYFHFFHFYFHFLLLLLLHRRQHIPPQLRFDDFETPDNEFALLLKGRYFTCREWIHRPFLHYVLHRPPDDPYRPQAVPIAQAALQACSALIVTCVHNHRHGATWSVVRRALTCAFLLLAAARQGFYAPLVDWTARVNNTIQYIAKWEREAVDLRWAKQVLEDILHDTLKSQPCI
ncbi:hypothetical protein McanCB49686_002712 [Microsporum canis]